MAKKKNKKSNDKIFEDMFDDTLEDIEFDEEGYEFDPMGEPYYGEEEKDSVVLNLLDGDDEAEVPSNRVYEFYDETVQNGKPVPEVTFDHNTIQAAMEVLSQFDQDVKPKRKKTKVKGNKEDLIIGNKILSGKVKKLEKANRSLKKITKDLIKQIADLEEENRNLNIVEDRSEILDL